MAVSRKISAPTIGVLFIVAFFWAVESGATPVLDQSYELGNDLGTVGQPDNAQTLTVGLQGTLSEVQVQVRKNNANAEDLVLEVRGTAAGVPLEDDATVLAGTTISAATLQFGIATWVSFDVSSFDIDVEVGDMLAIALRVPTTNQPANYFWLMEGGNPYAGGQRWGRSEVWGGGVLGGTWNGSFGTISSAYDMNFRTFIETEQIPEPATVALMCLGLAGIGYKRRKQIKAA